MRVYAASALALVVLLAAGATGKDEKAKDADLKAMVGKWTVEKAELGGKDITEHLKTLQFEIRDGGKYTVKIGDETDEGTFTVDPGKKPRELDVKPTGGPNKGKTVKGLYKLDGDTFTVCYNLSGGDRPKAFESKPDTTLLLTVYKRKK
ncbi:MAG: hypothetical protein JWO38_48 [Gemmataceae bacterium]|nr:hypothetical protein [Gemmataceae bacterium]